MNLKALKLDIHQDFGKLGEKRIKILRDLYEEEFSEVQTINGGLLLANEEERKHLIVNGSQITLSCDDPSEEFDFNRNVESIILQLFDKLLLEEKVKARFLWRYEIETTNSTFKESTDLFNRRNNNILKENQDIIGVGYRFLKDFDYGMAELKIEPLIEDEKKWFIENSLSFNEKEYSINKILRTSKEKIDNFEEENASLVDEFIKK